MKPLNELWDLITGFGNRRLLCGKRELTATLVIPDESDRPSLPESCPDRVWRYSLPVRLQGAKLAFIDSDCLAEREPGENPLGFSILTLDLESLLLDLIEGRNPYEAKVDVDGNFLKRRRKPGYVEPGYGFDRARGGGDG